MRVLAFFVVVFVFLGTLQLITRQEPGYADTFQLLVEPVEPGEPPSSRSPGSSSVVFAFLATLQLITRQEPGYADTFQLFVEPIEPGDPPSSCSPGSSSRSFSWYFKTLVNYFNVEVDYESLTNFLVHSLTLSAPSSASDISSPLKFSLEAKRDFQGQIFAKFSDANGLPIQRIPEANSFPSTPSSDKHYPSFTQENTLERFEQWQWRKKEKELLFFRVPRNACQMEVFFEESR